MLTAQDLQEAKEARKARAAAARAAAAAPRPAVRASAARHSACCCGTSAAGGGQRCDQELRALGRAATAARRAVGVLESVLV